MKYVAPFFWIVFISFSFNKVSAQAEKDTLQAWRYYQKADSLLTARKHIASIEYFQKALPIYQKAKNWERVVSCYNKISENHWRNYSLEKALTNAKKALKISNSHLTKNNLEESNAYENIGECHYKDSRYENALENYKKSLDIRLAALSKNHKLTARGYNNIGRTYFKYRDNNEALKYFNTCLDINRNILGEKHLKTAGSYENVGAVLSKKGEKEKALEYKKKGLMIRLNILDKDHPSLIKSYSNIGSEYKDRGDYKRAVEYLEKAKEIGLNIYGENHPALIATYHNIGLAYQSMKEYDQALDYFTKGLNIILNRFGENHEFAAHSYNNLGYLYEVLEEYPKALEFYIKSQEIYRNSLGENNAMLAFAYNYTGYAYYLNREFYKALEFYKRAIQANSRVENFEMLNGNLYPDQFFNVNQLLVSLERKARALKVIYKEKSTKKNLEECIYSYENADESINIIRQSINNRKDKVAFAKKAKEIYQGAIEVQLLLYGVEENQESLESAFYYAEKSKANTLKELLNTAAAKNSAGLPEDIADVEKTIKTDLAFYRSQVVKEQSKKSGIDTSKIKEFENQLFDLNRKQDSLTAVLEKEYPKYYQLKYQNEVVTVSDIQDNLDEHTTVLAFFTSDSSTYAFLFNKNTLEVQELSTPNLADRIQEFKKAIISKDLKNYKINAHSLYKEIISPLDSKLIGDQLIIIPDGPLWHLNFDLLLTETTNSNNPKELPYWLKKYTISYANSATMLFNSFKNQKKPNIAQECLAFSFSDTTNVAETKTMSLATLRDSGDDLPGTREEIRAISNIINGQYFFGSQAIETNFKNNADKYNILHLALHGEVDHEKPENSRLFFTKSKDSLEDNFLYGHELFALNIPAELTVLSACNTGTGKLAKGEGIMSLGNAFQYAGTKSLLLTGWEVSDQTTPELMKYFYGNLKKGMSKAKALQQAKLQYLNTANINRTHPFYWGGFYLVGDPAPIHFDDNPMLSWILGLGVLVVLFLALFWFKRRKQNS